MTESSAASGFEQAPRMLGRYEVIAKLASGGMGTVYLARHSGEAGFQRLYAVKVMHPHLGEDLQFVHMLLDEARLAARIHHPNVVPIVDLGSQDGSHYVAMEYVEGTALSRLLTKNKHKRPPRILVPIVLDALSGLHAAHTLMDDEGEPMNLVHRDISPHNVLVGVDGTARITDFGIAKAESRIHSTRPGEMKGKLSFMSPEHLSNTDALDGRSDLFSVGAMLWSALTGRKLFLGKTEGETLHNILLAEIPPPSTVGCAPPAAFDAVILKSLERDPDKRFRTAREMEEALRDAALNCHMLGTKREIEEFVRESFANELVELREAIRNAVKEAGAESSMMRPVSVASGFRVVPTVGALAPLASDSAPSSPSSSRLPTLSASVPRSQSTEARVAAPTAQHWSRRTSFRATLLVGALAGAAAIYTYFLRAHPPAPISAVPQASSAPAAVAVSVVTPTMDPVNPSASSAPSAKIAGVAPHKTPLSRPPQMTPAEKPLPTSPPARSVAPTPAAKPTEPSTGKPVRLIEKEDPYK